jgi:NADH-quinone oxidoreductase subunit H
MDAFALTVAAIKAVLVLAVLLTGFAYATYFERRVIARMQSRVGPNVAGPFGLLQPAADGLKLLFKENFRPATAEPLTYYLAPIMSLTVAVAAFAVIPVSDPITLTIGGESRTIATQLADFNIALLYALGITSLGVYGIVLAGWSSDNKYSLLGGLRSAAQMVSYELAMGASLVGLVLITGTLSIVETVAQQGQLWYVLLQPLGAAIFVIAVFAETNRAPFDLPEAEQELIGGFHTEYTAFRFAMFYMAEYIHMITASALAVSLFFGGYRLPFVELPWFLDVAVLAAKIAIAMFVFVWVRASLPRMRYDRLMRFGWKVLLPLALLNIAVTALGVAWFFVG